MYCNKNRNIGSREKGKKRRYMTGHKRMTGIFTIRKKSPPKDEKNTLMFNGTMSLDQVPSGE